MKEKTIFNFYIDRGGTFTDVFYRIEEGELVTEKVIKLLSEDPDNYPDAPREAIQRAVAGFDDYKIQSIRMGTTVATNALLERKGARTAFLTTKGFKDLLEIAYQNRPKIFDLDIKKPKQLYEKVVELEERTFINSYQEDFIDLESIRNEIELLKKQGVESLAIALIHSYKKAAHEKQVKDLALELGFTEVSISSELVPMIKYVPRASTTVIDAYLAPIIKKYIENFKLGFADGLKDTKLLFMCSDGSLCKAEDFRGYNSILSGPAGGLTALRSLYRDRALIGFDMGGTSTDISRFAGDFDLSFDSEIEGLLLQSPQLDINTIAAGGGSRLFYENGLFRVGPESAGSHPGPVCYKKNGYLAITDANLILAKLDPESFPKVFGPNADEPLDYAAAYNAFENLKQEHNLKMSVEEIAEGFIKVANETMARPIREVSSAKGFDVKNHDLVCFGGAAGQHVVAIAKLLGIKKVIVHRYSGILSAFGISLADQKQRVQKAFGGKLREKEKIESIFEELIGDSKLEVEKFLNLRYEGTDTKFLIKEPLDTNYEKVFNENYKREFGFNLDREIICEDVICEIYITKAHGSRIKAQEESDKAGISEIRGPALIKQDTATIVLEEGSSAQILSNGDIEITLSLRGTERRGNPEKNPVNLAIFSNRFMSIAEQMGKTLERTSISTNIKERRDFSCAIFNAKGDLIANAPHQPVHLGSMGYTIKKQIQEHYMEPGISILSNHPTMGGSHLPDLTVITPVYSTPGVPSAALRSLGLDSLTPKSTPSRPRIASLASGNSQSRIAEISKPIFFVANRAHHADVGGISPGSMPSFSKTLDEEGIAIKSFNLVENNVFQEDKLRGLFKESRLLDDNVSDLQAQVAANNQGIDLIQDLINEYSQETVLNFMDYILENSEMAVRELLKCHCEEERSSGSTKPLSSGEQRGPRNDEAIHLEAHDFLDDGSVIKLKVSIDKDSGKASFDFTGTVAELDNNLNTPIAVVSSAVLYCLRAMLDQEIPLNQGFLRPIEIIVPENSLLNPSENKAVVAGNVLTSQRIVDVIFKAFDYVAASQGCMNNLTFGRNSVVLSDNCVTLAQTQLIDDQVNSASSSHRKPCSRTAQLNFENKVSFGYYETVGGGAGAGKNFNGASAVHTHMTNTRITDPEILESRYPVILREFSIRKGSGGHGKFNGGDGIVRVLEFLDDLSLSVLSERRNYAPYGLEGGEPGAKGENWLIKANGEKIKIDSKAQFDVHKNDKFKLLTPGGGGFGKA